MATTEEKIYEFERQRATFLKEHEDEITELKKLHEESLKVSLQKVYSEYDSTIRALSSKNEQLEDELSRTNKAAESMVQMHRENVQQQMQRMHEELSIIQAEMKDKEEKLRQDRDSALLKALKA